MIILEILGSIILFILIVVFFINVLYRIFDIIVAIIQLLSLRNRIKKCTKESIGVVIAEDCFAEFFTWVSDSPLFYKNYWAYKYIHSKYGGRGVDSEHDYYSAKIKYMVNGAPYESVPIVQSTKEYKVGTEVKVRYNPDNVGEFVDEYALENNFNIDFDLKKRIVWDLGMIVVSAVIVVISSELFALCCI